MTISDDVQLNITKNVIIKLKDAYRLKELEIIKFESELVLSKAEHDGIGEMIGELELEVIKYHERRKKNEKERLRKN